MVTIVAAVTVLGGLIRLAVDNRVAVVALPEPDVPGERAQSPDDARAPLLSRAMRTLAVGRE